MEKGVLRVAGGTALLLLLASSAVASQQQIGYIGCLFSEGLCDPDTEYCYDDGAFGRCLQVFASEANIPNMRELEVEELAALEDEMSALLSEGYGWADQKTQCVMEALLDAIYTREEYSKVHCDELKAPRQKFEDDQEVEDQDTDEEVKGSDVAYIRYTPNDDAAPGRMAEFANELYDPPPTDIYGQIRGGEESTNELEVERRSEARPSVFSQLYNTPDGFRTGFESRDSQDDEPTDSEVRALEALLKSPQPSLLFGDSDASEEDEGFAEGWWSDEPITAPYLVMRRSAPLPPPPQQPDLELELEDLELPDDSDNLFHVVGPQGHRRTQPKFYPRESEHDDNILNIRDLFNGDKRSPMQASLREDDDMFNTEPDEEEMRGLSQLLHQLDEWSFQRSERLDVKKPGPHFSTNNYINQETTKSPPTTTEPAHDIRIEGQKETMPNEMPNRPSAKDHIETKKDAKHSEPEREHFFIDRNSFVKIEVADRMHRWREGAFLLNAIRQHMAAPFDVLGTLYVEPYSITFTILEPNMLNLNASTVGKKIEQLRYLLYSDYGFNITGIIVNDSENLAFLNVQEERMKKANKLQLDPHHEGDDHYDVVDTTYTYIKFKDKVHKWNDGSKILHAVAKYLDAPGGMFTNLRVDQHEITFKVVEPNRLGMNASMVAHAIDSFKDRLRAEEGVVVTSVGVGDKTKLPSVVKLSSDDYEVYVVLVIVVGVLAALALSASVLYLTRTNNGKMANIAQSDAEPSKHYQDLCRARMSSKNEVAPAQRVTSLSRESENGSPSSRSSTSSWSEEPALSNMDVTTGQMVLSNMEEHLKNKERLDNEWTALCSYQPDPCSVAEATQEENKGKNRYPKALPFDHARVLLNHLSNITGSAYINASTISDHDPRNPAYILTQGPLPATAPDFWQMVWEQGCVVIVMLTRLVESDTAMCHRYWPEEGSELYHIFEVHLVSEHIWCDDYLVRSFYLKNMKTGETRTVTQFHFLSWPEANVPQLTKPLLEFRRKVNKSFRGRSCPIVVHCNDGLGRSGTYCLLDMVLNRMAKGAKEIDIAATLEHIRDQRGGCVKTKQQFEFVISAVADEVQAILRVHPNNQ